MFKLGTIAALNLGLSFFLQFFFLYSIGVNQFTDAYYAGQLIPLLIAGTIGSALTHVLVPIFVENKKTNLKAIVAGVVLRITAYHLLAAIILFFLADAVVSTFYPSFNSEQRELVVQLIRIFSIILFLNGPVIVLQCYFYSLNRFILPEVGALIGGCVAVLVALFSLAEGGVILLVWLLVFKILIQFIFQFVHFKPDEKPVSDSSVNNLIWSRIKPLLSGPAIYKLGPLVDRTLASYLPSGTLTLFSFTYSAFAAGLSLSEKVITNPYITKATEYLANSNKELSQSYYKKKLVLTFLLGLACFLTVLLFVQIIIPNFLATSFDANKLEILGLLVIIFSSMFWAGVMGQIATGFLFSAGRTRIVVRIAIQNFLISTVAKLVLFSFLGIYGVALGVVLYQLLNLGVLYKKRHLNY